MLRSINGTQLSNMCRFIGSIIMSLVIVLKFIHFLSIVLAGGITIGGAVVQRAHAKAGVVPAAPVISALRTLGLIGLTALVLLWISGIGLAHSLYGGLAINTAFNVKLFGASLLLAASLIGNYHLYQSAQAHTPPNAVLMRRLQSLGRASLLLVIGGVAVAFSG